MSLIRLGALWQGKEGGKAVMSGTINSNTRVLVLKNNKKEKPNQPDFHLFLAENEKKDESGGYGNSGGDGAPSGGDDEPLPF